MPALATLERLIGTPMPIGELLPLAIRMAGELAELHGRGALHGRLSPAAILVNPVTGAVTLASHGQAARGAAFSEGALPYMSPEQTGQMNRPIDSRSDLYALGIVLYQLLAGRLPFDAEDAVEWVHCHVARQPRPLDQARPTTPPPLVAIVGKLLAKLPDHRYQSASGLRHDLERCLRDLGEHGAISTFPLGERDLSEELRIPQKLYGRDAECAALREAFRRVAESGTPELILISGYAGIGKSSVVRELLRPIAARRGRFVAGKFEQYKRDIPYFTISQALRELALDILAESEPGIAAWRRRLAQALGANGKLIVDLVPQLELIVGPQPPVPELPLTEGETRLHLVFGKLFAACAAAEHPLAMFIDDMQWADTASLRLVAHLMTDGEARHLLIVGAYRDNEVDATHPMRRVLDPVGKRGARVHELVLEPLSEADVDGLVADTVHAPIAEAAPLAGLVREKTGGNPFFAIQFLTALYHKRVIWLDREASRWQWDLARVRAEGYTDNLAELMRERLYALPPETQAALQLAACIGGTFDAATLATAAGRDLAAALGPAVDQHLLLESVRADRRTYRFPHDRVHEAAYALLPEPERARAHLEIGRRLLASTPPEQLVERVFEIVHQLDRGAALIEARPERERLAELYLAAGERAQASTAYASALRYFAAGAALLATDPEARPELAFALELHRAECELLTGALDAADPHLDALARRAVRLADLAKVTAARLELYTTRHQLELAVGAALAYLRRAGIDWSPHPTFDEVRREYDRLWQQLGSRRIEDVADLPPMRDPELVTTLDLLAQAQPVALLTDENLDSLLILRIANLSLEHGNSDASCFGYAAMGAVLRTRFGDHDAGFRFGQVGLALQERRGRTRWQARVHITVSHRVFPWAKHVRSGIELARRGFDEAKEAGELTYAAYACNIATALACMAGAPLAETEPEAEAALAFLHKLSFGLMIDMVLAQLQLIRALRGKTRALASFSDATFDEESFAQRLEAHASPATGWYWLHKVQALYLAGDHAAAVALVAKLRPILWTLPSFPEVGELVFYAALACAAHHDGAPEDARPRLAAELAADHAQLAAWAAHCPDNFRARVALAGAELARLRGDAAAAVRGYDEAILAARELGFVQAEAIAYETAARFYRRRGQVLIADAFVREAYARYARWGAEGKLRQLRADHPGLELRATGAGAGALALRHDQLGQQLGQLSVLKASQTISSVMDKDLLSRTLLRVVLEEGGARRVVLVFVRDGGLEIAAEARVDDPGATGTGGARLPRSLLAYVQRTHEPVLLDAAADAGRFAGDPYFADAHPCSVLCLPVRLRAESVALLYLENELVPGVFTAERLAALEMLAAQAAISLENAQLLERERAGRIEAEAAKHRELLLGEATTLMTQTLDYQGVLAALTRLCARSFADWAVVDLEEHGEIVRIAAAHRDPAKEPLLHEMTARYALRRGSATPVWHVLRSGEVLELPSITDEQIRTMCLDGHHVDLIQRLGTRSSVIVPLRARDKVIGTLGLTSATPHRFGRADVELAAELGRRASLAIDNARLVGEMRRALSLREEFLRIASHELRTPLASLRLTAQALMRAAERKRAVPPEFLDASLRRVLDNTRRLDQLTSELLDVTRIEHGRLQLAPADVALDAIVREAVGRLEADLSAAGSAVSIECAAPIYGWWDPSRLEQVVTNLVGNAAKFGAGKPIVVRLEERGDEARLTVIDHGIGIDPARRPHIFDRFERAVPSSSYGGLGLGLYIARSLVLAHGGTITVESEPGAGSTFTVTLPRAALPRSPDPSHGPSPGPSHGPSS